MKHIFYYYHKHSIILSPICHVPNWINKCGGNSKAMQVSIGQLLKLGGHYFSVVSGVSTVDDPIPHIQPVMKFLKCSELWLGKTNEPASTVAVVSHQSDHISAPFTLFITTLMIWLFSALTLMIGSQEEHAALKTWLMRYWHGYLSGARCKWLAYGPADATATPSSLLQKNCLTVWYRLTRLSWKKDPIRVLVYAIRQLTHRTKHRKLMNVSFRQIVLFIS